MDDWLRKVRGVDGLEPVALLVCGLSAQLATAHQLHLLPLGGNRWGCSH